VRLWNPREPDDPGHEIGRHDEWVLAVAATADEQVASAGDDWAVRLWEPRAANESPAERSAGTTAKCGRSRSPATGRSCLAVTTRGYGCGRHRAALTVRSAATTP
jgi:hypothetical protein